ncbi:hypothetical protein KCP70_15910 [Salmonella enterica subsp. enterica]|nr:hypothetical protein KCP70_15910 [Salmonella enterica subsp. enterica]
MADLSTFSHARRRGCIALTFTHRQYVSRDQDIAFEAVKTTSSALHR